MFMYVLTNSDWCKFSSFKSALYHTKSYPLSWSSSAMFMSVSSASTHSMIGIISTLINDQKLNIIININQGLPWAS